MRTTIIEMCKDVGKAMPKTIEARYSIQERQG